LKEIKPVLHKNNFKKYNEIFFETGKHPLWSGYSIGYFLVKKYLEKQKTINWKELLKINPEEILKEPSVGGKILLKSIFKSKAPKPQALNNLTCK